MKSTTDKLAVLCTKLRVFVARNRWIAIFLGTLGAISLFCTLLHFYLSFLEGGLSSRHSLLAAKPALQRNVMLVVAHPDDECLFFGPSVRWLVESPNHKFYIICLSIGNYYGVGQKRRGEFFASCATLGIETENIRLLDHKNLQDVKGQAWNVTLVADVVLQYVQEFEIDEIITFDERGISEHLAHISLHYAIRHLLSMKQAPQHLKAYALMTTGLLLRKCLSILDLPYSYMSSDIMFTVWWGDVFIAQKAFVRDNWSQVHWSRIYWVLTSPYMIFNPLVNIPKETGKIDP